MISVRRASSVALALALPLVSRPVWSDTGASTAVAATEADAAVGTEVRLDVTPENSPVAPLLRAELSQLGLDVVDDTAPAPVTIRVVFTSESLEVSIVDGATGDVTGRELFSVTEGRRMDARTAALHAAEFLRWHLRTHSRGPADSEKAEQTTPLASDEPRPPDELATRGPAHADLRFALLPVATFSPGGTSAGFGGEIDLLRRWGSFGVRLLGAATLVNNHLSVPEGSIDVSAGWGGIEGVVILGSATNRTSLDLGAGIGVFGASLRGTANPDNVSRDDHVLTLAPVFDLRLRQRLAPAFALVLGGSCLVPLRSNSLFVLGQEVGHFGQAVLTLGLGFEFTLL